MDYKLIEQLQKLNEDNQLFKPASEEDKEARNGMWQREDSGMCYDVIKNDKFRVTGPHWIAQSQDHNDRKHSFDGDKWGVYLSRHYKTNDEQMRNASKIYNNIVRKYFKTRKEALEYLDSGAFKNEVQSIKEDNQLFKPNSNDDQNNRKEIELKKLQRDWPIGTKVKSEDNKFGRVYKINPENEFGLTIIVKYIDPHSDDAYSLGSFSPDELVKI